MRTWTKRDLVERIAIATDLRQSDVKKTVQAFLDLVTADLADGRKIELRDFGVFSTKTRAPRTARNPRTGEKVQAPAKRTVRFKPGRLLRKLVVEAIAPSSSSS